MAAKMMAMAMKVAGDKEGKGGKAIAMATRMLGSNSNNGSNKEGNSYSNKGDRQGRGQG
jgi:hypothetical protein